MEQTVTTSERQMPKWVLALFPLLILILLLALFAMLDPLSFFSDAFPPLEELTIQRVLFPDRAQIQLEVINGAPDPVTISQVLVDDAYWQFTIAPL